VADLFEQARDAVTKSALSRAEICRMASISPSSLSQFMAGTKGLSIPALESLVEALGHRIVLAPAKKGK
jgi:transcriptional regulator with XRE-family HTH domain